MADLKSFLDTKKFVNESEIKDQNMILINQLNNNLISKLQNQSKEFETKMIDKFESDLKNNYDLVVDEAERRRQVAFTEILNYLVFLFCDKVRNELDHQLAHKSDLEKHFLSSEEVVKSLLEIKVEGCDALFYANILTKVILLLNLVLFFVFKSSYFSLNKIWLLVKKGSEFKGLNSGSNHWKNSIVN